MDYIPFEKDNHPCSPCDKPCNPCDKPCNPKPEPVPPPIPPICAVPGYNPQQQMHYVVDRVNDCINRWNHIQARCYEAMNACVGACIANDVYYDRDEVNLQKGYDTNDMSAYSVIRVKCVDKANRPIFIRLGVAYDNETNSGVKQSIEDYSFIKNANAIMTAVNPTATSWEGTAMIDNHPMAYTSVSGKYIGGFNRHGVLQVFASDTDVTTLCQNEIVNCIGAVTPIILNGAVTEEAQALTTKSAICAIGFVSATGDKIMFQCGNADGEGMQGITVANLLLSMGCTTAVITSLVTNAKADNGGAMLYMGQYCEQPTNWKTPNNLAFWYVTKRPFDGWCSDFTAEIANLVQMYGQNANNIERLDNRIEDVATTADEALSLAQDNADKITVIQGDIEQINNEIDTINEHLTTLDGQVAQLRTDLTNETNARTEADEQLQANIDAEAEARENADNELQQAITAEQTAREQADKKLQQNIDTEEAERTAADATLQQAINQEAIDRANADLQITNNLREEISTREEADESLQNQITNIVNGTTPVPAEIPIASATTLGGIKVGANLTITEDGVLNAQPGGGGGGDYTAGNGITISGTQISAKAGNNITVDSTGINADLSGVQTQIDNITNGTTPLTGYLKTTGGTMSGNIDMGANKITSSATPSTNADMANKAYVDSVVKVVSDEVDGIVAGTTPITLPVASSTKLGGVKIGEGINVAGDGTISVASTGITQEEADARYLKLTGGTLTGDVSTSGDITMTNDSGVISVANNGGQIYKDNGTMIIKGTTALTIMIGEAEAITITAD